MYSTIRNIACILYLLPKYALAEMVAKQGAHLASVQSPMSISYVVQILISFLFVIGFILLLAWLMRRTGRFGSGSSQIIKIISSMSLGMREKILIVEVGGVNIVVGVAPGQVRTLHVIEGNIENVNKEITKGFVDRGGFKQLIEKFSK